MIKKTMLPLLLLLLVLPLSADSLGDLEIPDISFPDTTTPTEESPSPINQPAFNIYGYLLNYTTAEFYYANDKLDSVGVGNTNYLRLKADFTPQEELTFHTELSYNTTIGVSNYYVIFGGYGFYDLFPDQAPAKFPYNNFQDSLEIDHLWGLVNIDKIDIQFGKQPIGWGTGYLFNPTSRTSTAAFLDTVKEETPGTLSILPSITFNDYIALEAYLAMQEKGHKQNISLKDGEPENLPFGVKFKALIDSYDISVSWIKEVLYDSNDFSRSYFIGMDFVGPLLDLNLYGEGVYKIMEHYGNGDLNTTDDDMVNLLEFCVGFDYNIPGVNILTQMEYYHQGVGAENKSDYDFTNILSGAQVLQARNYLFGFIEKELPGYIKLSFGGFFNIDDSSFALFPLLTYNLYDNFMMELGSTLFFGSEDSEFNGEYSFYGLDFDVTNPNVSLKCKLSF